MPIDKNNIHENAMSIDNSPFARIKKPLKSDMNVVPYIDVMLVLLVIFMVTAPMLTTGVEVDLPEAKTQSLNINQELPAIVSLKENGEIYLSTNFEDKQGDQLVDEQTLVDTLTAMQQKSPNIAVLVNADEANKYGHVMLLMSMLQQAGIKQVGLLTQNPSEKK